MPTELDPRWEYWTPADPEVAWLLDTAAGREFRSVLDYLDTGTEARFASRRQQMAALGFRFGRAASGIDRPHLRLAPPRAESVRESRCREVACGWCRGAFAQARPGRAFCSPRCARSATAAGRRLAPPSLTCAGCGVMFAPVRAGGRYCSRRCAAPAGSPKGPGDARLAAFAARYAAGEPMAVLAVAFGVQVSGLKKWRRKLGLPARPAGNYSRRA